MVRKYVSEAPTGNNIDELVDWFVEEFKKMAQEPKDLQVHVTCCTDVKKMEVIVLSVVKDLLQKNLEAAGLISGKSGGMFRPSSV
jgi:methionine synthase II (cobalamin-independent)